MADDSYKMRSTSTLDIANFERDGWDDSQWRAFVLDRIIKMRAKRAQFDYDWDGYQVQENAVSFQDNEGNLQVSVPLEKALGEVYMGRTNGKCKFEIVPDGQANVEELMPTKFAMNFFLDGNGKDSFWKENKMMREDKKTLGSGIFYTGIRSYQDWRYQIKDGMEVMADTDILDEKKFEKIKNETWFFFPKRIHPKDFFIDDAAYGQPDVQYAEDCVYKEKLTATEFNERYANKSFQNTESVQYWKDINPKNQNDNSIEYRNVVVYHYFHRITKKYIIVANEQTLIFNGLFHYNDGKLPFVNIQHYSRNDRFWGEGISERVFWIKTYRSNVLMDILTGAAMSSGVNLLVGNEDQVGQDWSVGGRGLNLWRTTGGADKVQRMDTSPNLGYFTQVLALLDKETVVASGIDPMAQVDTTENTLGQQELLEANRSIRNSSVDENYNIGLDEALTMMLARVKQFAPALLSEKIKGKNGRVLKYVFPKIRIDGYNVEKRKGGVQEFVESIGKYGYFDLKPEVVQGVGVKVTTASTNSVIPLLERQKITEYVTNMTAIANLAATDPTGGMAQKLNESIDLQGLLDWCSEAYGYDKTGLHANSEKDKIAQKNKEMIGNLRKMITQGQSQPGQPAQPAQPSQPNPLANAQQPAQATQAQPQSPGVGPQGGSSVPGAAPVGQPKPGLAPLAG